ncbi:hypothetical protein GGI15_002058 [Coemansia interrupta]|uniref:RanBP2-type domain-containing protein n=1 Tax=Coemansia interrupta TaxID=1126814 RepID=A0A9W8LMJ6_9FUNG|nr:hypothetical protein GGI15_002058 [Coemansia interrupta]
MTSLSASLNDLCLDDTDSWNSVADVLLEALQVSSEELRASQKLLGKHVAQYVKIQTKQEEVKRIIETATSAIASPNATINDGLDPLQRECRKSLLNLYGHVSNTLDDIEVVLDDRVKPIETFNGSLSIDRKLCDLSQRLSEKNYELDQLSSSLDLLKIGKSADDAREAIQSSGLPSDVPCSSIPAVLPAASPLTAAQGTPWSPEDLPFSTPVAARRNRGFGLREEDLYTSSNPVSARAPTSPEKTSEEPKSPVAAPGSHSHPLFSKSKVRELVPRSHKVNRKASMALDDTSLDNTNLTDSEFSSSAMYLQVRQQRQMVRDLLTNSHRAAPVVRTPNANASVASSAVPVQNVAMPNLERYVGAFGKLKITKRVPTPEPVVPAPNAGASFGSVPSFGGGFNPTGGASLFGSGPATGSGFGGPLSSSHAMTSAPPANGQFTSFVPPPGAPPMAQGFRPTFGAAPASGQTLPNPASISFGSDEKWVCDTCLVPNQPSAKICVACDGFGSTAGTSATPAPAASNDLKWRCDMCLIENPPTTKICLACETPNSNTLDVSAGAAATPPSPLFGGKLMPTVLFGNSSGASTRTTAFSLGDLGEISTIGSGGQAMTAFIPPSNTRSAPTQPEYNSESDAGDTVDTDASEGYSDTGDDEAAHSCGSSEYSYDGDGDHVSGEVGEPDAEDAASNGSWEEYDSHGQGSDSADTTDSDEHPHVQESDVESENDAEVPKDPRVSYNVDSGSKKDAEVPTEEDGSEAGSQKEVDGIEPEPTTDPSVVSAVEPIADAEADGEIPVISETKPEDIPEPTPEPESATVPEESTAEPDNGHSAGTEASVPAMPAVTAADVDGVHKDDSGSKVDVGDNAESKDIEPVPSEPQTQSISEPEKNAGAESTPELDTDSKEVGAEADKPHVELNDELGAVPQETEAETDELHTESNDKHRTEAEREANTSPASVTKDATEDKARSTEGSSDILEEPVIVSASDAASQSSKINDDDDLGVLSADDKDDGDDKLAATVPKSSEVDHGHDSDGFVHISQLASSNESKEDVSIGSEFMSVVEAQSAAPFDLDGMVKLIGGASIEDVVSYALDSITSASRAVEEEYDTAKVTPPQDEATTDHEHGDLSPASDSVPEDTADNAPVPDGFELLSRPESIVDAAIFDSQDAALSDNENKDSFGVGDIAARLTDAAATATSDKDEDSDDLIFNTSPPASPYLDLANDSESGSESDSVSIKDLKTKSEPESKPLSDIAQGAASFFQPGKFGSIGSGSSSFFRSGTGAFANVGKSTIAGTQQPSSGGIPSALTRSDAPIPEFGKNLGRPAFGVSSMSNTKPAKSRESSPGVSGVSGQMGPGFSARANASFNAFASYARNVGSVAEDEPSPVSPHVASISSVPRDKPKTSPPAEARNDRPNRNDDPLRHLIEGSDDEGRADPTNQDLDYDSD